MEGRKKGKKENYVTWLMQRPRHRRKKVVEMLLPTIYCLSRELHHAQTVSVFIKSRSKKKKIILYFCLLNKDQSLSFNYFANKKFFLFLYAVGLFNNKPIAFSITSFLYFVKLNTHIESN